MLTKEQILKAEDLPTETVLVPEWGGEVIVRTVSGTEKDAHEAKSLQDGGKDGKFDLVNFRARLCAMVMVDEKGKRLFSQSEIKLLGAKSAKALDRVYEVGARLNSFNKADVEELAKNFEAAQSEGSTSN